MSRVFPIGLALALVLAMTGVAPAAAEALAGAHVECCADCDDPGCPEERGAECPPQCSDCVCPVWVAPVVVEAVGLSLMSPPGQALPQLGGESSHQQPPPTRLFRPPRLS